MDDEENEENELEYQYDSDQEYHYDDDEDQDEHDMNTSKSNTISNPIPNSSSVSSITAPVAILPANDTGNMKISGKGGIALGGGLSQSYDSNLMKVDHDNLVSTSLSSSSSCLSTTALAMDITTNATSASKTSSKSDAKKSSPFHPTQSGKLKIPDGSFFISEYSAITVIMENLINEVATLLDLNFDTALILLQYCRWNKEKLMDTFYSSSESSEKLLEECGVDLFSEECLSSLKLYQTYFNNLSNIQNMNNIIAKMDPVAKAFASPASAMAGLNTTSSASVSSYLVSSSSSSLSSAPTEQFMCEICGDMTPNMEAVGLGCHHYFCRVCYISYLTAQVSEGPACIKSHCPQHKCKQSVPKSMFQLLLVTPLHSRNYDPSNPNLKPESMFDTLHKYNVYLLRSFIEMTKGLQYCPAAGCEKVAVGTGINTVRCDCGSVFCCRCGEEAHEPCTCAQLADWNQKCMNESETANWILANTKKCPNCSSRIEKNQGCNHMNCKVCKNEFCWICMGPWSSHGQTTGGYYKCNRYDATKPDSSTSAAQKAKMELDRYLHYYQRYHAHDSSLKHAANQRTLAEKRMVERQESQRGSAWIDVQFLRQAVEQVIDCRRVLKYTYSLGYFLTDGSSEKALFEHQQEMLEKNTERLHEFTEMPLDMIDRTQVVNLTRVTERFMSEMLTTTEGGIIDMSSAVLLSSSPANLSYLSSSAAPVGSSGGSGERKSLDGSGGAGAAVADSSYLSLLTGMVTGGTSSGSSSSTSSSTAKVTTRSQNKAIINSGVVLTGATTSAAKAARTSSSSTAKTSKTAANSL